MSDFPKPVNGNPLSENPGAPVIPASMAKDIKPDTIGLASPGYTRNEQMRDRRERLEAQIAGLPERGGVDVSTLPLENEVVEKFDRHGNLPVSHWDRQKWMVKWKPRWEIAMAEADDEGWEAVSGDPRPGGGADPRNPDNWMGVEYIGKGPCAGTSLRGHVDVILCRMPREKYERMEYARWQNQQRLLQVNENFADWGRELAARGLYPEGLIHGRKEDPLIQRVFANGPVDSDRMNRMMRNGSLPGATMNDLYRR